MIRSSQSRGAIKGTIVDYNGRPISGAAILVVGDSPPHLDIAAFTNERGEYQFDGLVPGVYTLLINAQNRNRTLIEVEVMPDRTSVGDTIVE